jgi:hypothetical protein
VTKAEHLVYALLQESEEDMDINDFMRGHDAMPVTPLELDAFTLAYIEALFFTDDERLKEEAEELGLEDKSFDQSDLAPETLSSIYDDCKRFQEKYWDLIKHDIEQAGRDFWYNRNGHGCGFWDGDWPEDVGETLSNACEAFGQTDVYIGDDGLIYVT